MATILIGGGTGLVGNRLSDLLTEKGHEVIHLSRRRNLKAKYSAYQWNMKEGFIEDEAIEAAEYVINLAGAGIADKRWTAARKKLIIDSRVDSTHLMIENFNRLGKAPKAYLASAAIGYYGDRGSEWLDEESAAGKTGFLAESCLAWEAAIQNVVAQGWRTITYRIGVVLSKNGGALPKMILPAKFGMSSVLGSGEQYMSWIHIDDLCNMFIRGIEEAEMEGIYNAVAPNPSTFRDFTSTLTKVLNRPALMFPVPGALLRLGMGEMADVVLAGNRVSAKKIQQEGFKFEFTNLVSALEDVISREI